MTKLQLVGIAAACLVLLNLNLIGQSDAPSATPLPSESADTSGPVQYVGTIPPPETKLEKLAGLKGVVITKGYARVGEVNGDDGSVIRISAVEMGSPSERDSYRGLIVQVQQAHRTERSAVCFIDEDEIDQFIAAVGAIAKVQPSGSSPFTDVDASYRSRGDVEVINVNNAGVRTAGMRCTQVLRPTGQILVATAYFRLNRLDDLANQLTTGKRMLDSARTPEK
jgi:hypothetical protein